MSRILILCDAAGAPVETLAAAVADGARGAGAEVLFGHIPDRVPESAARDAGNGFHAAVDELADYDAIVLGIGAPDARAAGKAAGFLDRAAARRPGGALNGKVGSAFTAPAAEDEKERTLMAIHARLMRLGLVCVGLPGEFGGRPSHEQIRTANPCGAAAPAVGIAAPAAGTDALAGARAQGRHVADIANRLFPAPVLLGESAQTEHFMLGR